MKLYILGNGFDIAHDLKTSYWDFRCYLQRNASGFLTALEKLYGYYPIDPNDYHVPLERQEEVNKQHNDVLYNLMWKTFEASLGNPSEEELYAICDTAINSLNVLESGPTGIEDTLNDYFENQFSFVDHLQIYLLKWAKQIRLNKAIIKKDDIKNNHDLFLTFNYTPTLECVYGVPRLNICHIHGGIPPYCETLPTIGHGNLKSIQLWKMRKRECEDLFDEGGSSKCEAISKFYRRMFKDTDQCLITNSDFFLNLKDIDDIVVIGHSLNDVDIPYFKTIVEIVGQDIPWTVVYHLDTDREDMKNIVSRLGVKNITMIQSNDYWDR